MNQAGFVLLGTIVLTGSSNAVNLTDGLDGLAAGIMVIVSFAFLMLALIAGQLLVARNCFSPYQLQREMAIVAAAMMGACLGFLWFNCNPARVFMGDNGFPRARRFDRLYRNRHPPGIHALFRRRNLRHRGAVGDHAGELLQVHAAKIRRGAAILLCSPLHHHFQRKGWTESQVSRPASWLISAMLAAMALATVKLR